MLQTSLSSLQYVSSLCFALKICFVGRLARILVKRFCPSSFVIRPCRRGSRRGLICTCRRPKPRPSPSPRALVLVGGTSDTASLIACTTTALFLQVQDPSTIIPRNFIWSVPNSGSNACSGCDTVSRRIVGVQEANSFGRTNCPADETCVEVMIEPATLSELYSAEILEQFGWTTVSDQPLEPVFGCVLPTSSRDLKEVIPNNARQVSRVPTSCDAFRRVSSDGRCPFSDCFVGEDGDPTDCFFCGASRNDGCGPFSGIRNALIPDSIPFVFDFSEACCIHDFCYSSSLEKGDCDDAFLQSMLPNCEEVGTTSPEFNNLPIPRIQDIPRCPEVAMLYYTTVVLPDAVPVLDFHSDTQDDRLAHEASDQCAARCPTTQRSGGQGTTTLTVNLMQTSGTFNVFYNMFRIPDELIIFYEERTIFSTSGLVSGSRNVPVTYSGESTNVQVRLNAPRSGTAWTISVACPP